MYSMYSLYSMYSMYSLYSKYSKYSIYSTYSMNSIACTTKLIKQLNYGLVDSSIKWLINVGVRWGGAPLIHVMRLMS